MKARTTCLAVTLGALLTGAPQLFSKTPKQFSADPRLIRGELVWFNLTETQDEIARRMGSPHMIADSGADHISWQYQIGAGDNHDHTHILVFRRSTRTLVSVTRAYEPEQPVDALFPAGSSSTHHPPNIVFPVKVRLLSGNRLVMAMGVSRPGQPTGQLVLLRRSDLHAFYPWLEQQLAER